MLRKNKRVSQRSRDFEKAFRLSLAGLPKYTNVIRAECMLYPYSNFSCEEEKIRDNIMKHPNALGILSVATASQEVDKCLKKLQEKQNLGTLRECLYFIEIIKDTINNIRSNDYYLHIPQNIAEHLDNIYLKAERTRQKLTSGVYLLPVRYIISGIPNDVPNPIDILQCFGTSGDIFLKLSYFPNHLGKINLQFQMLYRSADGVEFVLGSPWTDNRMTQIMRPIPPNKPILLKYVDEDPGRDKFLECFYIDGKHPDKFILKIRRNCNDSNRDKYNDTLLGWEFWEIGNTYEEYECNTDAIPVEKILEGLGDLPY